VTHAAGGGNSSPAACFRSGIKRDAGTADFPGMISLSSPAAFAVAVAVGTIVPIALGFLLVRWVNRRSRGDERRQAARLAALVEAFLAGRVSSRRLAIVVREASETVLWSALERRLATLSPAERRRLGLALERNRHSARERLALLVDSPLRRELAAQRLGLLPSRASRRALRSAAATESPLVAFAALRALARQGDMRMLDWLIERPEMLRRRSPAERAALLRAFGRRALPRLTAALEQGIDDPGLLRAAIEAVGARRHRAAAPAFEQALDHADVDVRVAAARALGRVRSGPCSDALVRALHDGEWAVRAQAAWALGRVGEDAAVPSLAGCLGDRTWWVRRHAAYALSRLGERGIVALRHAAAASPDRYAREMAEEALTVTARTA
jgi:HEAT repeats